MKEIWVPIKNYEDKYEVSNLGNIRSKKGNLLKAKPNSKGYLRVCIDRNTKKYVFVHRLVAKAFVVNKNPGVFTVVNHIDFNPLNNNASNLEWTTQKENMRYSLRRGRFNRSEKWLKNLRKSNEKNGRSVIGINQSTGEIIKFICLNDCKRYGFDASCVCECCKGRRKTHKGYLWRYAE